MKKFLVRVDYNWRSSEVLVVKTKDVEKYMNELCKEYVDIIKGYEYEELKLFKLKRNSHKMLIGHWIGFKAETLA